MFILLTPLISANLFSQNVGIGTTNPQQALHLHRESNTDVSFSISNGLTGSTSADGGRIRMIDFDFVIQNYEAVGNLELVTNGSSRLLIKPSGNIGINNTDPQTVLHVNARPFPAVNFNEAIRVGGTTPYISFYDDAVLKGYVQASLGGFEIGAKSLQTLNFFTNDQQRMTITNAGDAGIGISTPQGRLHVHTGTSSSELRLSNNITTGAAGRGASLRMLGGNLFMENFEANGRFQLDNDGQPGVTITSNPINQLYNFFGFGTSSPKSDAHLHNDNEDISLTITNNVTTDDYSRGARLRMHQSNFIISNSELTGNLDLVTNAQPRIRILPGGNIGLHNTSPQVPLHLNGDDEAFRIQGNTAYQTFYDNTNYRGYIQAWTDGLGIGATTGNALRFYTNSASERMTILSNGYIGMGINNPSAPVDIVNNVSGLDFLMKVRNTGNGNGMLSYIDNPVLILPTNKVAILGSSVDNNAVAGFAEGNGWGVFGYSNTGRAVYGNSTSGYGVFGRNQDPAKPGGFFQNAANGIALEIDGAFKVTGALRPVFQVTAVTGVGGNTIGNILTLPLTNYATSPTDILIVTPLYTTAGGVYCNFPIGVWWTGTNWTIFNQSGGNMPNGAVFNVMVIKQ